jgi:cyanophycin synthetase
MLAHIQKMNGHTVGLTTTDGVYIANELVYAGDMTGPMGTHMVVCDPRVDLAVLEVARGGILKRGMGVPYCDVGAVTNVEADHIGLDGVRDVDELARVKRVVVEVARDTAVLNADDPRVRAMAEHCRARRICFVSEHVDDPFVRARIEAGDPAVTIDAIGNGTFIVAHRDRITTPVIDAFEIPATLAGIARHNVVNAAFATAMAMALRIPLPAIRRALSSFQSDFDTTPGRLNVFEGHAFKVVLDYAHNAAGYRRIVDTLKRLPVSGRRIAVVGMAGDRRDEDFAAAARVLAPAFDLLICRGETDPRGREPGEPPRVMARELVAAGADPSRVSIELDELEAVRVALRRAEPGDLVAVFGVKLRATWDLVREFAEVPARATAG